MQDSNDEKKYEVEERFRLSSEELSSLLSGAELVSEEDIYEIQYDFADYRIFKSGEKLRNRNGVFELKIKASDASMEEIEDLDKIKEHFGIQGDLEKFVKENMVMFTEYNMKRKKYTKEGFVIDIDQMSFGKDFHEIELIVSDKEKINEARKKILEFVQKHGIVPKKIKSKREEYLKSMRPELYKELFKNSNNEIKLK